MKLKTAIKIKENCLLIHASELYKEIKEADTLLIEAGKRLEEIRRYPGVDAFPLLPGETGDEDDSP